MNLIIKYSKIGQTDKLIYCKYSDEEEIAKAITFGHYKKIKNDNRLYLDTINMICFQIRGIVTDVHNNKIPNVYYFRNIGEVIEEHESINS